MGLRRYSFRVGQHDSEAFSALNWLLPFKAWLLERVLSTDITLASARTVIDVVTKFLHTHVTDMTMTLTEGTKFSVSCEEEDE